MKKNIVPKMIIGISSALILSACNGKPQAANNTASPAAVTVSEGKSASGKSGPEKTEAAVSSSKESSLNAIYEKMVAGVKFPTEMLRMDDEYLEMQFGFTPSDFDEYVYAQGEDTLLAESILLIKAKDAGKVDSIKEILENFVFDQTTLLNSYVPEQGKIAEKSVVAAKGNYVYMLMSSQVSTLKKIAADMIK